MKLWPFLMDLSIVSPERERPLHLWLPIVLLWPLLALVALPVLIATLLADTVLFLVGRPYHHYTLFVGRVLGLLSDVRGLVVRVRHEETVVDMTLY